ncbi:NADH dehydrogenase (ubiquinone) 39 kDa subunit [Carabus blaptoides fortunei]
MAAVVLSTGSQILRQQGSGVIGIALIRTNNYSTDVNLSALKRGTGGRSSFNGLVATVFGATGFTGRYVCNRLGKIGTQLIIPYRADHYEAIRLRLCGDLGQVLFHPYNLRDEEAIAKAVRYSNVVINLVGRDWETKNFKFDDVHVTGARNIARIAKEAGVKKFIHVSALNAAEYPEPHLLPKGSKFLRSKWLGEQAVREEFPEAVIFRPSDVYGQEDRFLRYYSHAWRHQGRSMPLFKNGEHTVKQPVYVSDLAAGIIAACRDADADGKIFQAVGPKRYKLSELVDWFHRIMRKAGKWGYWRYDMKYDPLFKLKVDVTFALSPSFPIANLHWERIERECLTDVIEEGVPTLEDLGVNLMAMEQQVPWELKPFRANLYYDEELGEFEKPTPPKVVV